MYVTVMRSLVYTGITSNVLAVIACLFGGSPDKVPTEAMNLALWILNYLYHRFIKKTW